jgi:cysteine synthase B
LVRINRLCTKENIEIYAKIEGTNPTGSIKDRIALKMIEQAEAEGALVPGKTMIEPTSGNTGIGLAMIAAVKGYDVEIVMSSAVSVERRKMIESFGGKVILTDASQGTDGAIREARRRVAQNPEKYFMPDQFTNRYNKVAHYSTTAEEIIRDTDGRITHFVSALGTSGTLMGTAKRLKELNPQIRIIEAHPVRGHYIQGLKNMEEAIVPEIYDPSKIDISIMIDSEEAFAMARRIVREEGIFCGISAGGTFAAALKVAAKAPKGSVILAMLPDTGERYLSTVLFEGVPTGSDAV